MTWRHASARKKRQRRGDRPFLRRDDGRLLGAGQQQLGDTVSGVLVLLGQDVRVDVESESHSRVAEGSYSYDANQRLSTDTVNGVTGSYTYDTLGNLQTDTEGSTQTTFSYNSANQLTQSVVGSNTTVYGWDTNNAWRTSQGPSSNPNQITYAYNAQGRMSNFANGAISEVGHATITGVGTAVSITPGVSTQTGDVVLAVIHANTTGNTITDNNGANAFTSDIQEDTASTSRYAIVHRIAVASEPASYAWTLSSSQNWSVEVRVFRGVASSVWDVAPSTATRTMGTSGTTATAPSMTTTSPGALGVLICLTDTSGGTTYSSAINGYGTQVTPGATQLQSSWTRTWSTPGATGTSAATKSASNDWVAHQVALKPAASTASYAYDAAGQRRQSTVSVAGVTTTTNYFYDDITLMGLSATQGSSSWRVDYLRDEEGTPYGGVYRSPATSTSPTYFTTITDSHGDVCELLDANGNAFAAYHYDAWGLPQGSGSYATGIWTQATSDGVINATLAGQIASRQVLGYASYAHDAESGLYYCSARYYDPGTRQWTTADSAKADGEESAYEYCNGKPINHQDPSGRKMGAKQALKIAKKLGWPGTTSDWATLWSKHITKKAALKAAKILDNWAVQGVSGAVVGLIFSEESFAEAAPAWFRYSGGALNSLSAPASEKAFASDFREEAKGGVTIYFQNYLIFPMLYRVKFDTKTVAWLTVYPGIPLLSKVD